MNKFIQQQTEQQKPGQHEQQQNRITRPIGGFNLQTPPTPINKFSVTYTPDQYQTPDKKSDFKSDLEKSGLQIRTNWFLIRYSTV